MVVAATTIKTDLTSCMEDIKRYDALVSNTREKQVTPLRRLPQSTLTTAKQIDAVIHSRKHRKHREKDENNGLEGGKRGARGRFAEPNTIRKLVRPRAALAQDALFISLVHGPEKLARSKVTSVPARSD